jgi:hypothetical protein
MFRATNAVVLTALLLGTGLGCKAKQQSSVPFAPAGGGFSGSANSGGKADASSPSGTPEDDGGVATRAGSTGSALAVECQDVPPVKFTGEDMPAGQFLNAVTAPADFVATRVVGTWEPGCAQPTFRVAMSDGACPRGHGHELTFLFDAQAIADGALGVGLNTLMPDGGPSRISVRYVRPKGLVPSGAWGTCSDSSSGTLDLVGVVETRAGSMLQGRFELELAACDSAATGVQMLSGTFNVMLRRGLTDVCPTK